jgi:hypothetical protein
MRGYSFFLMMGLITLSNGLAAQILKPLPIYYSHDKVQLLSFERPLVTGKSIIYTGDSSPCFYIPACSFKCTLPKGAIFCRMEDAIYNRLNFWVKFRMGTEDRYSN